MKTNEYLESLHRYPRSIRLNDSSERRELGKNSGEEQEDVENDANFKNISWINCK